MTNIYGHGFGLSEKNLKELQRFLIIKKAAERNAEVCLQPEECQAIIEHFSGLTPLLEEELEAFYRHLKEANCNSCRQLLQGNQVILKQLTRLEFESVLAVMHSHGIKIPIDEVWLDRHGMHIFQPETSD